MESFEEFRSVARDLAPWASRDRAEDHDPTWHEFGVLGHVQKVFECSVQIRDMTGIDIVKVALWHDIGKFVEGVRIPSGLSLQDFSFKGHETRSEEYLRKHKGTSFTEEELFLVKSHGVIRGSSSVEEIVRLCNGDRDLLKKLVFLCAADTAGKGHTPKQDEQRKQLAPKIFALALEARLEDKLASMARRIVQGDEV
jgi:hypothetical protein